MKYITWICAFWVLLAGCSGKKTKQEVVVDFSEHTSYNIDFIRAVGLQQLFNAESKGMDDLSKYFDTLSYERDGFVVLWVTKSNYEIVVKPANPSTGVPLFLFNKDSVYLINRQGYILKNLPETPPKR